jgi:hypothetical protein
VKLGVKCSTYVRIYVRTTPAIMCYGDFQYVFNGRISKLTLSWSGYLGRAGAGIA